jgi:hypothetical protein
VSRFDQPRVVENVRVSYTVAPPQQSDTRARSVVSERVRCGRQDQRVEMRTEVSHALRGHPVRCDRANYYGMPTGPFVVLRAPGNGRQIVALRRMARTPEAPKLPQHPVGPVATGPYKGRLGPRWPASAGALDYGFAATSRNR